MRNPLRSTSSRFARTFLVAFATLSLGVGVGLGCQAKHDVPPQKTGEGPNDPNVKSDDVEAKKKVDPTTYDEEPDPNGIELKPIGQGGGPKSEATDTPAPPTPPPPVKKPTPKPKPTTTTSTTTTTPPVWTPPPLPSGWVWPFPNPNAPPAGSTSSTPDAGGGVTLPPFGGS